MTKRHPVLVVGAGPVGLSVALSLANAGVAVRVIDAAADVDRRMRASTFHPPTLDDIETLGLASELVQQGLVSRRFQFRQHESSRHVSFDIGELSELTNHPFRLQVEQHRYCDLAIAALTTLGVDVAFGCAARKVRQTADNVHVTTDNGEICVDWLVGCDGGSSIVRSEVGLEYAGSTYTHSSVLVSTMFPFDEALESLDNVNYCWSERGPFSLLRLRQLWRASLYPGVESLAAAADEARIRQWLGYIHPDAATAEILDISPYRVHERCVDRFRVGRVMLAGDAAHLNPPSGGMGMNGGIHDAMNLSDKLKRVIEGEDSTLLDQYERQRRTLVTQHIIAQAAANRRRMATYNRAEQLERLQHFEAVATDPHQRRDFLLTSSMIRGLHEEQHIE